jgi:hypothetical protein
MGCCPFLPVTETFYEGQNTFYKKECPNIGGSWQAQPVSTLACHWVTLAAYVLTLFYGLLSVVPF